MDNPVGTAGEGRYLEVSSFSYNKVSKALLTLVNMVKGRFIALYGIEAHD
jgi:hypothetical protein